MVSFSCEVCNDTVVKRKLQQHQRSCRGSYFTCIDCSTTFYGNDHQSHTSCISEAEKYEKALYKGKKGKQQQQQQQNKVTKPVKETPIKKVEPVKKIETVKEAKPVEKTKESSKSLDFGKFINKPTTLYKLFKESKKETKLNDKSEFLKNVKISKNDDGSFSLTL